LWPSGSIGRNGVRGNHKILTEKRFFILNADDFGLSRGANDAILQGFRGGILKSASVCTNGEAFEDAVRRVLPACPGLGTGVHLNIIEGRSLSGVSPLTGRDGLFNRGFGAMLLHSRDRVFMAAVEKEFRAQIEKGLEAFPADHLDSHVHTHAIPGIFAVTLKLAEEYHIPWIRTQHENMYLVRDLSRMFCLSYPINIIKVLLLNFFTAINKKSLQAEGLKTNDRIIGVGYTGMMNAETVERGLRAVKMPGIVEALIHPNTEKNPEEYAVTTNAPLREKILQMGFTITNYGGLSSW